MVESYDYLVNPRFQDDTYKVFNLCKSYTYQSSGYYVSLLASARSHRVIPSITTILEMKSKTLLKIRSDELDNLIQKNLKDIKSDIFELSVYFGKSLAEKYQVLATDLHRFFHATMIRAKFKKRDKWRLTSISPISMYDVPESHLPDLELAAKEYFAKKMFSPKTKKARYSLAILVNPEETTPPSNKKAIQKFIHAANHLSIEVELISKDDIHRLGEFDGLFIRETTAVNHHTFNFAQKAAAKGLVVIDDPISILKCTNKVYLAELFENENIPAPKTELVYEQNLNTSISSLSLPAILKQPDSSFSQGVIKVETREELRTELKKLLKDSDLVLVQEFLPTDFDWRIGFIDSRPLFACKYYMAKDHWQIYKKSDDGRLQDGELESIPLQEVPPKLLKLASRCAAKIGSGLYGLDIKEIKGKYYVIEVNDNPNVDAGCEDQCLKDQLYHIIMSTFLERMEKRTARRY